MKIKICYFLLLMLFAVASGCAQKSMNTGTEADAIKQVLHETYVQGIHIDRDIQRVRSGFHPDFMMQVLDDDQIINVSLTMWLERLQLDAAKNEDKIDHEFKFVDIAGNSAVARMEIFENSKHKYTDYFCLYKFDDGWKIVGKIFTAYD